MRKNNEKKISKKFTSFKEEEQWLQSMFTNGWMLKRYDAEDLDECQYVFQQIMDEAPKNLRYKIDFRDFNKKADYEEYIELFEESGWTGLSKNKGYSKHIFFTTSATVQQDIFSDQQSYKDREKRKMTSSLTLTLISCSLLILSIILFIIFERTSIIAAVGVSLSMGIKSMIDYYKHRKVYQSIL